MARGNSGRIVIDVKPEFKVELYNALSLKGRTLKDWFLEQARDLCDEAVQPRLLFAAEPQDAFGQKDNP